MYLLLVILAAIGVLFAASAAIVALVRSIGGELGNAGRKLSISTAGTEGKQRPKLMAGGERSAIPMGRTFDQFARRLLKKGGKRQCAAQV